MMAPKIKLAIAATSLGLVTFVAGIWSASSKAELGARVLSWPRSSRALHHHYAVRVLQLEADQVAPVARGAFRCHSSNAELEVIADESGFFMLTSEGDLLPHRCEGPLGSFVIPASPALAAREVPRAVLPPLGARADAKLYLESPQLSIGIPSLAWLVREGDRVSAPLQLQPEPGLSGRVLARCPGGVALELTASFHVTSLAMLWPPAGQAQQAAAAPAAAERFEVLIPVSRGGPSIARGVEAGHFQLTWPEPPGWLGVFDGEGLLTQLTPGQESAWPLPPLTTDAVLVAHRASFFDSSATVLPLQPEVQTGRSMCERGARLAEPSLVAAAVAPQWAEVADGTPVLEERRAARARRGRGVAASGIALAAAGAALALVALRRRGSAGLWLLPLAVLALLGLLLVLLLQS